MQQPVQVLGSVPWATVGWSLASGGIQEGIANGNVSGSSGTGDMGFYVINTLSYTYPCCTNTPIGSGCFSLVFGYRQSIRLPRAFSWYFAFISLIQFQGEKCKCDSFSKMNG
ncbi:hypothetical protein XENTR_v10000008 [Xenopus tropicalis]|nr:hypothetical protein XENTR_v10000008 [Xenopus tropicalis]